jgi:hypothetical protein
VCRLAAPDPQVLVGRIDPPQVLGDQHGAQTRRPWMSTSQAARRREAPNDRVAAARRCAARPTTIPASTPPASLRSHARVARLSHEGHIATPGSPIAYLISGPVAASIEAGARARLGKADH